LSRGLYATHNTILQVIASIVGFVTIVGTALLLGPAVGIFAIPLAYAVGTAVKVALLGIFLADRLRRLAAAGPATAGGENGEGADG
jgi:peptidoglycan biosynthesis protein MviN/MurJ (putative lipid II flippase)